MHPGGPEGLFHPIYSRSQNALWNNTVEGLVGNVMLTIEYAIYTLGTKVEVESSLVGLPDFKSGARG